MKNNVSRVHFHAYTTLILQTIIYVVPIWLETETNHLADSHLIFNTADSRRKIKFFIKIMFWSLALCVQNETIVANIVFSKPYPRNLLVAFIFLILTFMLKAAFRPKFEKKIYDDVCHLWSCYILKMMFLAFPQKKPCIKTSKNAVFRHIRPNTWLLRQKLNKSSLTLKFGKFPRCSQNLKVIRYKV
jgi:hypothetical protein